MATTTAGLGNTFQKNGKGMALPEGIYVVPLKNDAGEDFVIDTSGDYTLTQAILDGWLKDADKSQRMTWMGKIDNWTPEKSDNVVETTSRQNEYQILKGIYKYNFQVKNPDTTVIDAYDEAACSSRDLGFLIVDACEKLYGEEKSPNMVYPIPMAKGTYSGDYLFHTDTETGFIMVTWNIDRKFKAKNLNYVGSVTADLLNPQGLIDVNIANISNITTTGFDFDILMETGGSGTECPVEGLVTEDFSLDEISPVAGNVSVTISDNGDVSPKYSALYAAQDSDDILELTGTQALLDKCWEIQNSQAKRVTTP